MHKLFKTINMYKVIKPFCGIEKDEIINVPKGSIEHMIKNKYVKKASKADIEKLDSKAIKPEENK